MDIDFEQIYHLLFETYIGVGILVGAGLVISLIAAIILEVRTRKLYKNHKRSSDGADEWSIFEEDVEEGEAEEMAKEKAADAGAAGAAGAKQAGADARAKDAAAVSADTKEDAS